MKSWQSDYPIGGEGNPQTMYGNIVDEYAVSHGLRSLDPEFSLPYSTP